DDRRVVVTCVARMEPVKNHVMLIEAARLLHQAGAHFELWLVGGGEGRARCEAAVAAAGLGERIHLLGCRDDVPALPALRDIGVLTSLKEGIPRAALEAMAVGLPMVATRVTGTREVVRDGDTGFLVDVDDPVALAAALAVLIDDAGLRARMGARGREVVCAEYDEADVVRGLERAYRDGLHARGIAVPAALAQEVSAGAPGPRPPAWAATGLPAPRPRRPAPPSASRAWCCAGPISRGGATASPRSTPR